MARTKVTKEEAQRIKKTREIKQRKNSLKAEQVSAPIEAMDLKIVSVLSFNKFLIVYMCCAIYVPGFLSIPTEKLLFASPLCS